MSKEIMLSVVICTYNRDFILQDCLSSILPQVQVLEKTELILIDNASTDGTRKLVQGLIEDKNKVKYIFEPFIGLSNARNRGWKEANGDWVLYLDDDAKANRNLLERAFSTINSCDFDAFGGQAVPWYKFGKPKWMHEALGGVNLSKQVTELDEGDYFSGMIMLIKRDVLSKIGGFSTKLGMSESIGYGEETKLQIQMKRSGYVIGFDPLLVVDHCILPHKLKLMWHLHSIYAHGRDGQLSKKDKLLLEIVINFSRTFCTLFLIHLPYKSLNVLRNRNYYIQNAILDSFGPFLTWAGRLYAMSKKNKVN